MAKKYLDDIGLSHFFDKLKLLFATKDVATQSADGLMSSSDKTKLDGLDQLVESASGESVTTSNCSGLESIVIYGKFVQDGTPTPDAPVDVQVVETINLIDWSDMPTRTNKGVTWSPSDDGWVYASGTASATSYAQAAPTVSTLALGMIAYCEPGTYTAYGDGVPFNVFSMDSSANGVAIRGYATEPYTFTLAEPRYIQLGLRVPNGTVTNKTYRVALVKGFSQLPYAPYGSIGLKVNDTIKLIGLQGNVLASLPDSTKDVLTVDSAGHCVLTKAVNRIASYNGESVGSVYVSTTGQLTTGAEVYYKASSTSTIDLDYIDIPDALDGTVVSIVAAITPTINVSWWTVFAEPIANAIKCIKDLILQQS